MAERERYYCAACQDPEQGELMVNHPDYVAKDNYPKYWAVCQKHYDRTDAETQKHYARFGEQNPKADA